MAKKKKPAKKAAAKAKPAAKKKVSPVPAGYGTVTPYLVCRNAAGAINYYKKAFGAKERARMLSPDGSIGHAELQIGNSIVMLGDENPQMGQTSPETVGGTSSGLFIYVENVDQWYGKAIKAGAKSQMEPADMFWGDRYCKLVDPFGHQWSIATHIEDMTPKDMERRGKDFFAQMAAQQQG